jgi:hypothetical protein
MTDGTASSSWSHQSGIQAETATGTARIIYSSSSFSHVKIKNPSLHIKVVLNGSSNKTVLLVVREILCTISACQISLILLTHKYYPTPWQWISHLFQRQTCNTAHVIVWQLWNVGGSLKSVCCCYTHVNTCCWQYVKISLI